MKGARTSEPNNAKSEEAPIKLKKYFMLSTVQPNASITPEGGSGGVGLSTPVIRLTPAIAEICITKNRNTE